MWWSLLGKYNKVFHLSLRFSNLAALMKAMLCIPHSNASSERSFSMVKKILTENRMSMDNSTLCALMSCKINYTAPGYKYAPSNKVLAAAKHATYQYNKSLADKRNDE